LNFICLGPFQLRYGSCATAAMYLWALLCKSLVRGMQQRPVLYTALWIQQTLLAGAGFYFFENSQSIILLILWWIFSAYCLGVFLLKMRKKEWQLHQLWGNEGGRIILRPWLELMVWVSLAIPSWIILMDMMQILQVDFATAWIRSWKNRTLLQGVWLLSKTCGLLMAQGIMLWILGVFSIRVKQFGKQNL
jgi:hypothetical protein